MNDYIVLLVGESGSGKTTVANLLEEKFGLRQLRSYTTRLPRHHGENCHQFVTPQEFVALPDVVAYSEYAGEMYCATAAQVDASDVYVIDPVGVNEFLENYHGKREPLIIYLEASKRARKARMKARGDTPEQIKERLLFDKKVFREFRYRARCADHIITISADEVSALEVAYGIVDMIQGMQEFYRSGGKEGKFV